MSWAEEDDSPNQQFDARDFNLDIDFVMPHWWRNDAGTKCLTCYICRRLFPRSISTRPRAVQMVRCWQGRRDDPIPENTTLHSLVEWVSKRTHRPRSRPERKLQSSGHALKIAHRPEKIKVYGEDAELTNRIRRDTHLCRFLS